MYTISKDNIVLKKRGIIKWDLREVNARCHIPGS